MKEEQYVFAKQKEIVLQTLNKEYPLGIDEFKFKELIKKKIPEFDAVETREFIEYLILFKKIHIYYNVENIGIIFRDGYEYEGILSIQEKEKLLDAA